MTTGYDSFETGGLSSAKWWVPRRTGDPRSDVMLDRLPRVQGAEERLALSRDIHKRLGAACAEYPLHVPALAHAAITFVLEIIGEDEESDLADDLFELFREAEILRSDELSEAGLASEEADLAARAESDRLFGSAITNAAESLGRCCAASVADLVERLVPFTEIARDADERDLRLAAELGRAYRHKCQFEANAAVIERLASGKPFEVYEVDDKRWSPSPPCYYSEIAEREAVTRAEADEAIVRAAEAEVAEGADRAALLSIARVTAKDTLASPITVDKLCARLLTASDAGSDQALARVVEVSIEVARENREKPLRDGAVAARVDKILAGDRAEPEVKASSTGVIPKALPAKACSNESEVFEIASGETADPAPMPVLASGLTPEEEMEALTHVPGLVGDLVDWICATSRTPNRTLAFAAAVVFVGTIAGRIYKSPTALRTNIYTLGLAPSGFGKDAALKCIDSLASVGGLGEWMAGGGIKSGSGMRKRVEQHPAIVWMIDEFGGFFKGIGDARAPTHQKQIRDLILTYFSTAGSVYRGDDYAGERGVPCHHPNVCIHGVSTPIDFWGRVSKSLRQ